MGSAMVGHLAPHLVMAGLMVTVQALVLVMAPQMA
jgi:hypothetical protein